MRSTWMIALVAAVGLAACQPREPTTPQGPGAKTAAAPPSATTPVPPPTVQPPAAVASACPTVAARACPTPAVSRRAGRVERRGTRYAARPQRRASIERDPVDIPPYGGYRYGEIEDREIERRYAERRYEGEYGYGGEDRVDRRYEYDQRGETLDEGPYAPPPPARRYDEAPPPPPAARREDRYSSGGSMRRGGEAYSQSYSTGPVARRYRQVERGDGYVARRSGHVAEAFSSSRSAYGGVRRYEERSYESSSRESYREQGYGPACCSAVSGVPGAGRDANGFLSWPGKVPALP